ncbi:MAG: alpha/beta fold hydrolase [Betaproteobacteria bacterium]|nr:alpha/beta fold hydrolase [Betaproteobacteria bacterium]
MRYLIDSTPYRRVSSALRRAAVTLCLAATAVAALADEPILFVHGNGDTAALWHTTLWRFASNGYDEKRLFTLDLPYPLARSDDAKPQEGRSSTAEYTLAVADKVQEILRETGASKVVLVGNSRGGYPIRSYIKFGGGAKYVSKVVLGGVPNHGVWANEIAIGNEFNGNGPFLRQLNQPDANGNETTEGVEFLTLRSDKLDKFAQPTGEWVGQAGKATNVGYDGPALRGAQNLVLPGRDHREVSFHPEAFKATYRFITGKAPAHIDIVAEARVTLAGQISRLLGNDATNLPLAGARLDIYQVNAATGARIAQRYNQVVATDGRWGPFPASPEAYYEFVITAEGYATTHIYRSPFPRSSAIINMRPAHLAPADNDAGSVITMTRPRGYFGVGRDIMAFDGQSPPPGIPASVPGVSTSKIKLPPAEQRSVTAEFNGEKIVVQSWPTKDNHIVFAEFHY